MTSSSATKVLLAHIALWALTTARDYGKLGHFIVSAPIASLSVCLPQPPVLTLVFSSSLIPLIFHLFVISNPSFNLDFNYFPFTRLSAILSFLHLPHSPPHRHPLPSTLIALLFLQGDRVGLDSLTAILSPPVLLKGVYITKEQSRKEKRGNCGDLCFFVSVLSQRGSVIPTATAARKSKTLCLMPPILDAVI